jgi:hypothetical protein
VKRPLIEVELNVGMTREQADRLELAARYVGMKNSAYVRQALVEKLVQQGFLPHPLAAPVK